MTISNDFVPPRGLATRLGLATSLVVCPLLLITSIASGADEVVARCDFETDVVGQAPAGWMSFTDGTRPTVTVVRARAGGSKQCVRGVRSEFDGLVALSKKFASPQRRLLIEFSFAFSGGTGRSLNVWSHEPGGRDGSQFNLCIQQEKLMQYDGRTRTWKVISERIEPSADPAKPVWHRLRAIVDSEQPGIDYWLSEPGSDRLPEKPTATRHAYRTGLPLGGIDLVSGRRIAPGAWYLVDDLVVRGGEDLPAPHEVEPLPKPFTLWTGPPVPSDVEQIPYVSGVRHQTIHRATPDGYKFLHGAAIIYHQGTLFANWANSPTNENGPHETLQGRRSADGGRTWSDLVVIGPGFDGPERHSHGVLFVHRGELWTICARFGVGTPGRRFPGLKGEAFVLNEAADCWQSRGVVMHNCWPCDQPVRMENGNWITAGQDKDGLPVVAVSHGDDLTRWDSILIPYPPELAPSFAETTVWPEGKRVLAVIRGGGGVAWVSTSGDYGRTWSRAEPSNLPMPRAKPYLGKLSTGQLFLLSNLKNRDTLVISVSRPGEHTLSQMWRIRHGRSEPPRFPGRAKGKQWSYPYGYEHDGRLYVVYSIGKEDCGLSVMPVESLRVPGT